MSTIELPAAARAAQPRAGQSLVALLDAELRDDGRRAGTRAFAQTLCPVHVDLITSLAPPQPQDEFDVLISRDLRLPGTESWELWREQLVCVGSPALVRRNAHAFGAWPLIRARSRPDLITTGLSPRTLRRSACMWRPRTTISSWRWRQRSAAPGLLIVPKVLVADALRDGTLALATRSRSRSGARYVAYVHPASEHAASRGTSAAGLKGVAARAVRGGG
jgi:hypothetical protein